MFPSLVAIFANVSCYQEVRIFSLLLYDTTTLLTHLLSSPSHEILIVRPRFHFAFGDILILGWRTT